MTTIERSGDAGQLQGSQEKPNLTEVRADIKIDEYGDGTSQDNQPGVRAVEATTTIWNKWHLVGAYAMYATAFYTMLHSYCPGLVMKVLISRKNAGYG